MLYLETGSLDPAFNLAFEEYVLRNRGEGDWFLLWQNAPSVIIGQNQNPYEEVNCPLAAEKGIPIVRRSSGGGAVYHDLGNLNYSFITDAGDVGQMTLEFFGRRLIAALAAMGVEAELSGRNDILAAGRKVSGTAQRLQGKRILHHGTLLFETDGALMAQLLTPDAAKYSSKSSKSVRSRVGQLRDFLPVGMTLPAFWVGLKRVLTGDAPPETLSPAELAEVSALAREKYGCWDWNFGRAPSFEFRSRRRFPGGLLDVQLSTERGCIRDIRFYGDFLSSRSLDEVEAALKGCPYRRDAMEAVLQRFSLPEFFGSITRTELLGTVMNE